MMNEIRRVKDVMTRDAVSVQTITPLKEVIHVMSEKNISCVLVNEKKQLAGIITERDLVQRVLDKNKEVSKLRAKDVMTKTITSVSEEATLQEAMHVVENMNLRRLVVLNKQGVQGIITQTDIVKETHHIHEHNQRLAFHQNLQSYIIIISIIIFGILLGIKFFF